MSRKKKKFSNPAFSQKALHVPSSSENFNIVTTSNSFNSIFQPQQLENTEVHQLETLFKENQSSENDLDSTAQEVVKNLKTITEEIRSIAKQGAVLIGERVFKARELLKPFRDGTFSQWLEITFGNRKQGYNMLSFYELYTELPSIELKEKYKGMPPRAAYALASRKVDLDRKAKIINECHQLKYKAIISIFQQEFSTGDDRKKKTVNYLLGQLKYVIDELSNQKSKLNEKQLEAIISANKRLTKITASPSKRMLLSDLKAGVEIS